MTEQELQAIERRTNGEDVALLVGEIRRLRLAIKPVVAPEVWYDGFAKRADEQTVAMVPEPLYRALQEAYRELE